MLDSPDTNLKHEPPVDLVAPPQTLSSQAILCCDCYGWAAGNRRVHPSHLFSVQQQYCWVWHIIAASHPPRSAVDQRLSFRYYEPTGPLFCS
jgi:hypothetical protein